jgi:hypothetical protein
MYTLKTRPSNQSAVEFVNSLPQGQRKTDCLRLLRVFSELFTDQPVLWGDSIVGFGIYRYANKAGDTHEWFRLGFSPRSQNLTIYVMEGYSKYADLLSRLGKFHTGVACLYMKRLDDIDIDVLKELLVRAYVFSAEFIE